MADKYIMPEIKEAKRLVAELGRGFEEMKAKTEGEKTMSAKHKGSAEVMVIIAIVIFIAMIIGAGMAFLPVYSVWHQTKIGQGELARAEQNRQIAIQEAKAKKESAALLAEAEIERAKGVAEANKIIGDSLKDNEGYLRYLWIDKLGKNDIIYVPTEANIPIMEAGRRAK